MKKSIAVLIACFSLTSIVYAFELSIPQGGIKEKTKITLLIDLSNGDSLVCKDIREKNEQAVKNILEPKKLMEARVREIRILGFGEAMREVTNIVAPSGIVYNDKFYTSLSKAAVEKYHAVVTQRGVAREANDVAGALKLLANEHKAFQNNVLIAVSDMYQTFNKGEYKTQLPKVPIDLSQYNKVIILGDTGCNMSSSQKASRLVSLKDFWMRSLKGSIEYYMNY